MNGPFTALNRPELGRLWDRVAERLQRNGMHPVGTIVLNGLSQDERYALAGLLARPVTGDRVRIDLGELDTRLRLSSVGARVVDVVEALRGPLADRQVQRRTAMDRRSSLWDAGKREIEAAGLSHEWWVEAWLDGVRRSGMLSGLTAVEASTVLLVAIRCLGQLCRVSPPDAAVPVGRAELASLLTGSPHGLDDGTILAAVVLRGVALATGLPPPSTPTERRAVWGSVGVMSDEVATTVLTLGLRPLGDQAEATALRRRSEGGLETHLTLRDLRRLDWVLAPETTIFVCQNPTVLEAAMDLATPHAVICTQGNPTVILTALLDALVAGGGALRYRADFDWHGLTMTNRIMGRYHGQPWRMAAADYQEALERAVRRAVDLPALAGPPVMAAWDADLAATMARYGRAADEELLLDLLVADLV